MIKLVYELLEIFEMQKELLKKKDELLTRLINENMEKENMINELMRKEEYLY